MNKKQKELQDLLMELPMGKMPKSLKDMIREVGKKAGLSGGVIADVIENWILALDKE